MAQESRPGGGGPQQPELDAAVARLAEQLRAHTARPRERKLELIATVLLALAAVGSAWSAYQASRWSGTQTILFNQASARRAESVRASNRALMQMQVDVGLFVQWVSAQSEQSERLASFLERRFREEFRPAFEAWRSQVSEEAPIPPDTPFALPEYRLVSQQESLRLEEQAGAAFEEGKQANQTSDNFILTVVLFATVLFFVSLETKLKSYPLRLVLLAMACVMMGAALSLMLYLPQNVGF